MKFCTAAIYIFLAFILFSCNHSSSDNKMSINDLIGDSSFLGKFGKLPDDETDVNLRIQTHLTYVEELLRSRDVSTLTTEQKRNRLDILDKLHAYSKAGIFPQNADYRDQTRPCFIDNNGNICAVGYLIEQTVGRDVAESINAKYKYEYVLNMQDPIIDEWIASNGLTKKECAMIQPSYPWQGGKITQGYAISSSVLLGANVAFSTANIIQLSKNERNNNALSILGMSFGAAQLTLGIIQYVPNDNYYMDYSSVNNLSILNMAMGTSSMVIGLINLLKTKKYEAPKTSWNTFSAPLPNQTMGYGLSICRRF